MSYIISRITDIKLRMENVNLDLDIQIDYRQAVHSLPLPYGQEEIIEYFSTVNREIHRAYFNLGPDYNNSKEFKIYKGILADLKGDFSKPVDQFIQDFPGVVKF